MITVSNNNSSNTGPITAGTAQADSQAAFNTMLDSTQTQQFATISQQDQGSSGAAATSLAVRTSGTQGTQVAATGKPAMLGKNNADEPLPTAKGEISETEWNDPVKLVGKLTQVSADTSATDAAHSNMRCGASNLLASTLLQKGRDGAADMLEKEAANAGNSLTQDEKEELKGIAGQLRSKAPQMRYDDLSMAQDYLYKIGNAGTHPGMKKGESIRTAQAGGLNATGIRYDDRGGHAVQQVLDGLVPGQSVLMLVSSDSPGTTANHFITVGKRPHGEPFIYNSYPAKGDYTLAVGSAKGSQPEQFTREVAKYSERAKNSAEDVASATPAKLSPGPLQPALVQPVATKITY